MDEHLICPLEVLNLCSALSVTLEHIILHAAGPGEKVNTRHTPSTEYAVLLHHYKVRWREELERWLSGTSTCYTSMNTWVLIPEPTYMPVGEWPTYNSSLRRQRWDHTRASWPVKLVILASSGFDCEALPPMNKAREGLRMTSGINLSPHMHVHTCSPTYMKTCLYT